MTRVSLCLLFLVCFTSNYAIAQVDTTESDVQRELLSSEASSGAKAKKQYVMSTFKTTHIINGESVENLGKGILDFRILHRFGQLSQGAQNFFGLDNATTRIALDYGITNWLMVGLGHSTLNSEDDGFAKIRLLRQVEHFGSPVTISYVGAVSIHTGPAPINVPLDKTYYFSNRLYFTNQLLIARKFNQVLSLQLMPTIVHYNLIDSSKNSNNVLAMGAGARIKLSSRIALTGEYFYVIPGTESMSGIHNSFSVGVDIETGGHVFQLHFTNSVGMTERTFISETTDSWAKGQLHFGFNISRVFTVARPKEFKNSRNKIW